MGDNCSVYMQIKAAISQMAALLYLSMSSAILRLLLRLQPLLWGNALHSFDFQLFRFLSCYFLFITQKHHTFVWRFCCASFSSTHFGAEGGIRTLARFNPSTPLAGEPLIATWVLLHGCKTENRYSDEKWRREWDSNPRLLRVTGFQDRLLKPLGHLSSFSLKSEATVILPCFSFLVNTKSQGACFIQQLLQQPDVSFQKEHSCCLQFLGNRDGGN